MKRFLIEITYGYSRDLCASRRLRQRSDLKQFMMDIFSIGNGDIPLFIHIGDGNESEKNKFPELIKEFKRQWAFEEDGRIIDVDKIGKRSG